jgi:pyruvate formate lyase activating enzyme
MKIGGYLPFTLSDYPGKVASIVYTKGCNYRCPFCHNGDLISIDKDTKLNFTPEEILGKLSERRGQIDGVVITGGEPTCQMGLIKFAEKIKAMGFLLKLDTNGSAPETVRRMISNGLVDYIAMDIKSSFANYDKLTGIETNLASVIKSIAIISSSSVGHEFRTTFVPRLMNQGDLDEIRRVIPKNSVHKIQEFKPDHTYDPALRVGDLIAKVEEEVSKDFQ